MRCRASSTGCLLIVAIVGGCADPLTPIGPGSDFVPEKDEMRLWETSRRVSRGRQARGVLYDDNSLREYVQSVLVRLFSGDTSSYTPLDPQVQILDSEIVNAFALPNGHILIHTGFLGRLRNEAQLAMLLGHEITHATHRHGYQWNEDRYARTGALSYVSVISALGGENIQNLVSEVGKLVTYAAVFGYRRKHERESDRVGMLMMARAGYDPHQGEAMFNQMLDATDEKKRGPGFFYATHPKMKERVKSCRALLAELPPEIAQQDEIGRDRYLDRASDLIYGEARRHIAHGDFMLAYDTLEFMSGARPSDSLAAGLLGDLYRARGETGDTRLARKAYQAALEIDPDAALALRGLGLLLGKSGETETAIEHLQRYLAASPDATDAGI